MNNSKENLKKTKLYRYVTSDANIFLAIYELESYIFDKELLDEPNQKIMNELRDVFNERVLLDTISKVKRILDKVLLDENEFIDVQVYFKPKKFDEELQKIVYRPIHTAEIYKQIASVAMLHAFIYEIPDEVETYSLTLSNYSRLIPSNFYGNRVSLKPEELFKNWSDQYKEYTHKANEYFKEYHSSGEYAYEVKLDLKNFYPSISPAYLFEYLTKKMPVTITGNDIELYKTMIIKLCICKVTNLKSEEEILEYYGESENGLEHFTRGIPQGLPQSYFFGNMCMIEIADIFNKIFSGKSLYYVDDSVIYTNDIKDSQDFSNKLIEINKKIAGIFNQSKNVKEVDEYLRLYNESMILYIYNGVYNVSVHDENGKSSYSMIQEAQEGEIYMKCLSREASKMGFEIYSSYSDQEDRILYNRMTALLDAIEKEEERVCSGGLNDKLENYTTKLTRYKKFFKYRKLRLYLKQDISVNAVIKVLWGDKVPAKNQNIYDIFVQSISEQEFMELYREDIWATAVHMLIRNMPESEKKEELRSYIKEILKVAYKGKYMSSAFLAKSFQQFLENKNSTEEIYFDKYRTLDSILVSKLKPYTGKEESVITKMLREAKELHDEEKVFLWNNIFSAKYNRMICIVNNSSDELKRMVLNAIYSRLFNIQVSESFILAKITKKPILYSELRCLIWLRNRKFSFTDFEKRLLDFLETSNMGKIDYSIMEVGESFRNFIRLPELIDDLILVHQYTCDVWKNGSKHLYFYTLHNQEHAVDLIKNVILLLKVFSFLQISYYDYYVLFIACYLHDISMVKIPSNKEFLLDDNVANQIAWECIGKLTQEGSTGVSTDVSLIKKVLIEFYRKIDDYFESKVRNNHARDSANEIRIRDDLGFLGNSTREMIAEIAEAHGADSADVYNVRSAAKGRVISMKFDKILLRLADLLDMSEYRVSRPILNHNIENMSRESAFHWVSHILTKKFDLKVEYEPNTHGGSWLEPSAITEHVHLIITVDMSQMSNIDSKNSCKQIGLCEGTLTSKGFDLHCGASCDAEKCNFLCKWFITKNKYLINEFAEMKEYLNRVPNKFFASDITITIKIDNVTKISDQQFEIVKEKIGG